MRTIPRSGISQMPWPSICLVTEDDAGSGLWLLAVGGRQSHEFAAHAAGFYCKFANARRQSESSRPRAPGIEVEHSVACLLFGNVTVAADHHREPGCFRLEVQLRQIVQHIDRHAGQVKNLGLSQLPGPCAL